VGRALLAVGAFYACYVALAVAAARAQDALAAPDAWWRTIGRGLMGLSAAPLLALLVLYAGLVVLARRPPASWGMPRWRSGVRGAGEGLGWGLGLAAGTILLCILGGAEVSVRPTPDESFVAVAAPLALGLALAALLEELMFRGYPLARLAEAVGPRMASVVLAVAFAFAHARNPEVGAIGLANIALAALLLSVAFFTPGGLATAFGLHLGWNAGLVFAADAPVSGLRFRLPALEFLPGPRTWWTGGWFGPEGGLAATLVLGAGLAWWMRAAYRARQNRVREAEL